MQNIRLTNWNLVSKYRQLHLRITHDMRWHTTRYSQALSQFWSKQGINIINKPDTTVLCGSFQIIPVYREQCFTLYVITSSPISLIRVTCRGRDLSTEVISPTDASELGLYRIPYIVCTKTHVKDGEMFHTCRILELCINLRHFPKKLETLCHYSENLLWIKKKISK